MSSSIFRKKILSQLSSPDQLDSMIAIEKPRHWLIAVVLLMACAGVATWSVIGEVRDRINSTGILITSGSSVADIVTAYDGQVQEILVTEGESVVAGQGIAILLQRDLPQQIAKIETDLAANRQLLIEVEEQTSEAGEQSTAGDTDRRARLNEQLRIIREDIVRTKGQLEEREKLFEEKIITQAQLEQSRQQYQRKLAEENQTLDALDNLQRQASNTEQNVTQRVGQLRLQVQGLESQLEQLRVSEERGLIVEASVSGTITEIKSRPGAIIGAGTPVASIETTVTGNNNAPGGITFLNFIAPGEGKKVVVGQDALITLSSANPNDYGKVKGTVTSVSQFPVSLETVVAQIANQPLARSLFEQGAPYAVEIQLLIDPELLGDTNVTNSFQWTAKKGNLVNVSSGTYAQGEIIYQVRSPITLFIPALRRWFGGGA